LDFARLVPAIAGDARRFRTKQRFRVSRVQDAVAALVEIGGNAAAQFGRRTFKDMDAATSPEAAMHFDKVTGRFEAIRHEYERACL
jgi:hypothetical protein